MAEVEVERSSAEEVQDNFESKIQGSRTAAKGSPLQLAHTPDKEEYMRTAKISAIGIIILGAVGFAIMWVMTYLPDYF